MRVADRLFDLTAGYWITGISPETMRRWFKRSMLHSRGRNGGCGRGGAHQADLSVLFAAGVLRQLQKQNADEAFAGEIGRFLCGQTPAEIEAAADSGQLLLAYAGICEPKFAAPEEATEVLSEIQRRQAHWPSLLVAAPVRPMWRKLLEHVAIYDARLAAEQN